MVTVGNQGQDDRYIRLWRRNISLPVVSRLHDCQQSVSIPFFTRRSWQITWKDWIDLLTANNPSCKREHYFSFSVLLTTFSRQTSILCCVIIVDIFCHQGGCCNVSMHTLGMIKRLNFPCNIMEWGPCLWKWWHLNLLLFHCGGILVQVRFHDVDNAARANVERSTWVIWAGINTGRTYQG